ncbi:MAG: HAMP domain-containing sensor histidine kinase [Paludibacter sp.]|nr:HAMP domain-containing sensor histidine kinase [Paludibacter sp.]
MSTKNITYLAIVSIVLILLTQSYLVFDYFQTVRFALTRETEAILKEAFRTDLNQRNFLYKQLNEPDTTRVNSAEDNSDDFVDFDMGAIGVEEQEGLLNKFDLVMHAFISRIVPININNLDSIIGKSLQNRNINSQYYVQIINPQNEEVLENSKDLSKQSFLVIPSELYLIDLENKQALKLILVNPFSEILKRMGLMILGSIVFSIILMFAFQFLIKILAKQKKLVKFKNEFLSNIAHELKRPVASLIVNLDCLKEPDFFNNEGMKDMMLNNSINSLTELNGTISMIVGLAKVEEGLLMLNKLPVNLVKLMDDLTRRFISSPSKKVKINTEYDEKEVIITADGLMLTQCFANLIDNSIKYSKTEVTIDISLKTHTNTIELNFQDTGIGIPADKIDNIFEKYSRVDNNAKVNGFGIGLNYVKTIIEKHSGNISVSSELGKGSNFKIILPKK